MKITFLALLVLFALISQKPLLGAVEASPEQVVDITGKMLRPDTNYYTILASPDIGGLGLTSTSKDNSPLDVVILRGSEVVFTPLNSKKGVIRIHTYLNIYFNTKISSPQSNVWSVNHYDPQIALWIVTMGGVSGNPSSDTLTNWFKIEKYEKTYKVVFCPSVCPNCSYQCRDIGLYQDQYGKRLALIDVPYKVRFEFSWSYN